MENRYAFPGGRVAVVLKHSVDPKQYAARDIVRWEDMAGNVTGWGKVEFITYAPTLGEQYLTQRGVAA